MQDAGSLVTLITSRSPVTVPQGIFPAGFRAMEGSVYDSFAEGLPPVLYTHGQFYPLTTEELQYLTTQFAGQGSGGPEAIPQMPQMPTQFEQFDTASQFEQSAETAAEKAAEQAPEAEKQVGQQQATPQDDQSQPAAPTVLVNVSEVLSRGKGLVSQPVADQAKKDYQSGKLKLQNEPGEDSVKWLRNLLYKLFEQEYRD